jgi:hypothetical protein
VIVSELEALFSTEALTIEVELGKVDIDDEANSLRIGSDVFLLDELAEKSLAKYLKIPHKYLQACPPEFRAETLKFWLGQFAEVTTQFEAQDHQIVSIHSPAEITIPSRDVVGVVASVFKPEDEVQLFQGADLLHIDVTTSSHEVTVFNPEEIPFRPLVGDITRGGVRFLSYPHLSKPPVVSAYMERLVCTNGMCTEQKAGLVNIKGNTVDDVIEEMETAARRVLGGLDSALRGYASTSMMPVPGSLQAFAHQLAREYGLTRAVLDQVMIIINQLPPDKATVYDVTQAFTAVANRDVPYATRMKLQTLGGSLAFDAEHTTARCGSCERLSRLRGTRDRGFVSFELSRVFPAR